MPHSCVSPLYQPHLSVHLTFAVFSVIWAAPAPSCAMYPCNFKGQYFSTAIKTSLNINKYALKNGMPGIALTHRRIQGVLSKLLLRILNSALTLTTMPDFRGYPIRLNSLIALTHITSRNTNGTGINRHITSGAGGTGPRGIVGYEIRFTVYPIVAFCQIIWSCLTSIIWPRPKKNLLQSISPY